MLKLLLISMTAILLSSCANIGDQSVLGDRSMAVWVQNSGESNCLPEIVSDEVCADKARDDICVSRGKIVRWRLYGEPNHANFSLIFDAEDPFTKDCKFKDDGSGDDRYTSKNKKLQCKIRDDKDFIPNPDGYKYSVEVTGCDNPLDPRIYIREQNL